MEENMVNQEESFEAEDLQQDGLTEEPQDETLSIDEVVNEVNEEQSQEPAQKATERKEPGYVQGRIDKAVSKALAQQRAEYEAQMAPMREFMVNAEAQELVRTGKVKDLETARELVRYRQNLPQAQQAQAESQPRNEQGQFAPRQQSDGTDPATQARIDMLQHQADRIKAQGGPDVISEFRNNEDIKRRIVSGELDFYDVAEQMRSKGSRKAPAPMRSPNGASGASRTAIDNMSDEQFDRLVKKVQGGARYSQK